MKLSTTIQGDCEIVRAAADLLSDEMRWTRAASARDIHDHIVDPRWRDAVKFCAAGALAYVANSRDTAERLINDIGKVTGTDLVYINDTRGRAAVLRLFSVYLKHVEVPKVSTVELRVTQS